MRKQHRYLYGLIDVNYLDAADRLIAAFDVPFGNPDHGHWGDYCEAILHDPAGEELGRMMVCGPTRALKWSQGPAVYRASMAVYAKAVDGWWPPQAAHYLAALGRTRLIDDTEADERRPIDIQIKDPPDPPAELIEIAHRALAAGRPLEELLATLRARGCDLSTSGTILARAGMDPREAHRRTLHSATWVDEYQEIIAFNTRLTEMVEDLAHDDPELGLSVEYHDIHEDEEECAARP